MRESRDEREVRRGEGDEVCKRGERVKRKGDMEVRRERG